MGKPPRLVLPRRKNNGVVEWGRSNPRAHGADGRLLAGVARGPYKPLPFRVGARFGKLKVTAWAQHRRTDGRTSWQPRVRCDCGWEGWGDRHNLLKGTSTRCNACGIAKSVRTTKKYHSYADVCPNDVVREYLINRISAAISRCHNPSNPGFQHYGGRGIRVHRAWRDCRKSFLAHLVSLPGHADPKNDMDRIDNNKGYVPGNIRFVRRGPNMQNRRKIGDLQAEVQRLRLALRRAEKQIHDLDR